MSEMEIFAFIATPLIAVIFGWGVALWAVWSAKRDRQRDHIAR